MTEYVQVRVEAVDWLKKHYPALCEKSGLCERVGGRLYTRSALDSAMVAQVDKILPILKRLTAWAEALGPCTFSGDHPIAIARAFLDRGQS